MKRDENEYLLNHRLRYKFNYDTNIYILCGYYKKFIEDVQNTLQCTDIWLHNHIFKVVKVISQRSVKDTLSLLTQRERSILLCGTRFDLLGGGGGGGGSVSDHLQLPN